MAPILVYSRREDVLETKLDDEIVLMGIGKGEYFSLDEVASYIWTLLKPQPLSLDSLCLALQEEFEIDSATCKSDTEEFLTTLVEQQLLNAVPL